MTAERRLNWQRFASTAPATVKPQRIFDGSIAPFGFAFEVEDNAARRRLAAALRAEGIDARLPTGGSFTRHPYAAPWRDQPTPRADLIHDRGMFLGLAPYPIPDLIERAVAVMKRVL
jgi:dTDP-4-amino-4,6-dideoxygalactose transaminase